MATFSTNQVGQFIVANAFNSSGTDPGTVKAVSVGGGNVSVKYVNASGQAVSSDRIPLTQVRAASAKQYVAKTYRQDTITVAAANIVVGQEYSLKIIFRNWGSGSAENQYVKVVGAYTAATGDTAETIFDAIKVLADKAFAKEPYPTLTFSVSGSTTTAGLVITEVAQPWVLGKMQGRQLDYTILFVPIIKNSVELVEWGTITSNVVANPGLGNGKQVADMEYFFLGERGDIYRNVGYPYTLNAQYLVDSTASYDIVTIAYYFEDEGTYVQKSEKQLYIVCKVVNGSHAIANSIVQAFTTAGITIDDTEVNTLVTSITVTGASNATTITTDGGTLQMSATVLPANAIDPSITWSVTPGTGTATISAGGLLTAATNGTVTVVATANDSSEITGTKVITISNQT